MRNPCALGRNVKFNVDENLPADLVEDLRLAGQFADTVADEMLTGSPDSQVVEAARLANRILLTLDKGIATQSSCPAESHAGIVLFCPGASGRRQVLAFIRSRLPGLLKMELGRRLTVATQTGIRVR